MELKLSNTSLVAIVDDELYETIISHNTKWAYAKQGLSASSKIFRKGTHGRVIWLHRLVLGIAITDKHLYVDHINRDVLDNRKCNLRTCNVSQNAANTEKYIRPNTTSKFKGVSWSAARGLWQVHITKDKKGYFGGRFKTEVEAAKSANELMLKLHGEFAVLNTF